MQTGVVTRCLVAGALFCAMVLAFGLALPAASAEEKAVPRARISVDVPVDTNFALFADTPRDKVRFRYNETSYTDNPDNACAPQRFVSRTGAPIGIVSIADDTSGDTGEARVDFTAKVFRGKQADVSFTVSTEENGESAYTIPLGGSVKADPGRCLNGFIIGEAHGNEAAEATFWLGMDLTALKASDLAASERGQIASLCYTVALIDLDDSSSNEA